MKNRTSFRRCQPFPRTTESQLNSERRGKQNVNLSSFYFLQVACGNFCVFRQFILRQFLAHPLAAHVRAEGFDSLPFFLGNCHDILHRFLMNKMNDTYIVKRFWIPLAKPGAFSERRCHGSFPRQMNKFIKESQMEITVMSHIRHSPASEAINTK